MDNIERKDITKSIKDNNYTTLVRLTFNLLKQKFPYNANIFQLLEMLKVAYDIQEWDLLDYKEIQNANFESYLIDVMRKYLNGEEINFTILKNSIFTAAQFSESEKRDMEAGNIEERLWAIFLVITNPGNKTL